MEPSIRYERERSPSEFPPHPQRPLPVTLIALFQFAKSAYLFGLAALFWKNPGRLHDFSIVAKTAVYIAARGSRPLFFVRVVATYALASGWGLWCLRKWARNLLIVTSGMNVALWARYFLFQLAWKDSALDAAQRQAIYILILCEALVFVYLALYDGVPQAFGVKD